MQAPSILLVASLGAICVVLLLYLYVLAFERRLFLSLWFVGWAIIGINYGLDAFFPDLLRGNRLILYTSLISYFVGNLSISWGTLEFLTIKGRKPLLGGGCAWVLTFALFATLRLPDLRLIQYTSFAVFALAFGVGVAMIKSIGKHGKLAFLLGLVNIAWVCNVVVFSYILQMPEMTPYIISQLMPIINAIGVIQLFFREQTDEIHRGLAQVTYLTYHDELTGLYNKRYFDKTLAEMSGKPELLPISLLVGDMNGLKFVNDVFGHQEGDNWLREMAEIIRQSCRPNDIIARWGGDEIAVILPCTGNETAAGVGQRIREACESVRKTNLLLSMSLGIATATDGEIDMDVVLKQAEDLMYEAKIIEGKRARCAITEILSEVLQEKAYETREHIEALEFLAAKFARTLCMSREDSGNLVQAARLHDIGKIGVPASIVLKNSALDETEWSIMKKHVELGYRIAHASGEFAHLAEAILHHHEWWNGCGYPHGLKEEESPRLARIISILDAYDVMTRRQPYRPAMTTAEALDELTSNSGTQFDPHLVLAFVEMMNGKTR